MFNLLSPLGGLVRRLRRRDQMADPYAQWNGCSYEERVANEIHNHSGTFHDNGDDQAVKRLLWKVSAFEYAMKCYSPYLSKKMPGVAMNPRVRQRISQASSLPVRILSLGCATGDWELLLAKEFPPERTEVTLVDLNPELLQEGARYARENGLAAIVEATDVNRYRIKTGHYDYIVCRASLHHFIALEEVLDEVNQGLKPDGALLVIGEWIGRRGLQIYPETEKIANGIFGELPERFRCNYYTGETDTVLPNIDHSVNSFEAVRSEEILGRLLKTFRPVEYVAYDAMVTLLFDFRYGSNYDLSKEEDRRIVERVTALDIELLERGELKPTALFGVFGRS